MVYANKSRTLDELKLNIERSAFVKLEPTKPSKIGLIEFVPVNKA